LTEIYITIEQYILDLLHLIENMFDQKRIYANPSSYPNPKTQLCFRTDVIFRSSV